MKHLRTLLVVTLAAVMVLLCACPAPTPPAPGSSTTSHSGSGSGSGNGGGDPTVPTGATFRPSDTGERADYWQKLSAPTGNFATGAYAAAAQGLSNEAATPTSGIDLAYGFKAPYDGTYEVGADMLALAAADGEVTLTVYKNGSKIWPVSEDAYHATTQNGTARFTATTAAKKGDMLYIRASGNTTLNISPRVTLVSGNYTEAADIEKNFPTVGVLSDVGSPIQNGSFVTVGVTKPASGTTYGGTTIGNQILRGQITAGVYFANSDEDIVIDASGRSGTFDAKGAVIVTGGSVKISNLREGDAIKNLTIFAEGGVIFSSCTGGTLSDIKIAGGVTVEESAKGVTLQNCRITASGTAVENKGENTTLVACYVEGTSAAIVDTEKGGGLYIDSILKGYHTAVILGASDTTVRACTVYGDIVSEENLENLLVAECVMKNLGTVVYNKTHNSVILFNEVENVTVKNATNAYVAENAIYGGLLLDNIRYLIAEDNVLATAEPALVSVRDYNGDNVTDINARADVGVNEDLLPHINMDAFVNMKRKESVRAVGDEKKVVQKYIRDELYAEEKRVIVSPGAYAASNYLWVGGNEVNNASVYAYGVLFELTYNAQGAFYVVNCENLAFYGMTIGYAVNTSDQMVVVKKLGNKKLLCVTAAGTNPHWGGSSWIEEAHRWDEAFPYSPDTGTTSANYDEATQLWTVTCSTESRYEEMQVGDILTCRNGSSVIRMESTKSIYFEDVTLWGGAIRCFWDWHVKEGSILNRVADLPAAARVIDKDTYQWYKDIEAEYVKYGLPQNYLVYIDEYGNYRGMASRVATADGTHSADSYTGFTVTNCIFSGLSDDGSNHQGWFDRLYSYDEDTGILTYRYDNSEAVGNADKLRAFKKGERVVVFTSTGRLLVDTVALEDGTRNTSGNVATVKIDKTLLRESDLAEYDLADYGRYSVRVLIDNMSRNGEGAYFDNVLYENIRSRALLTSAMNVTIKNCTIRGIGMGAIALNYEIDWGESGFGGNILVQNNYIENTGYADNKAYFSPISIYAPAVQGGEEYYTYKNVTVEGNVVRNRGTSHALYACGVENLTIKNNDFGDHILWDEDCEWGKYSETMDTTAVLITFSKNVELSGNTYTAINNNTAASQVVITGTENAFGDDLDAPVSDPRLEGAVKITAYANHEPRKNPNGGLLYSGGWDLGFLGRSNPQSFTSFDKMSGSDQWLSQGDTLWSIGGLTTNYREYRYVLHSAYPTAIRYTMDSDATVALSLSRFYPSYNLLASTVEGSAEGLYAIFVNGEMVWPTNGGGYNSVGDWYYISRDTSYAEMERALADLRLTLSEGDVISFAAKAVNPAARSMFTAIPIVYYLEA